MVLAKFDPVKADPKNCVRTSEKYFLDNPLDLFLNISIFPYKDQSVGSKFNSILRLSMLITLFLLVTDYVYTIYFFIFSIVINIVFYFLYKKNYE